MGSVGRPMKYKKFLELLEDEEIYCPSLIVRIGERNGLFRQHSGIFTKTPRGYKLKKSRMLVRHSLAHFARNHNFPAEGDGVVKLEGQAPIRGWSGRRWKDALKK